ncbi:MAG: hypothetical protein SO071_08615, partial [Prevotella sp.]|nr:hypothetical protein [Prevotella sp.]
PRLSCHLWQTMVRWQVTHSCLRILNKPPLCQRLLPLDTKTTKQQDNKTTRQQNNKTTKHQDNQTTKQPYNKRTPQQNNKTTKPQNNTTTKECAPPSP